MINFNALIKRIRKSDILFLVLCCFLCSFVCLILQKVLLPDKYIARTTIAVMCKSDKNEYSLLSASHYIAESFSNAYYNNQVAQYTADMIGSLTKEEVLSKVNVNRKDKTVLVKITAEGDTQENAMLLSKSFAEGMSLYLKDPFRLNSIVVVEEPEEAYKTSKSKYAIMIGIVVGIIVASTMIFINHMNISKIWDVNVANKLGIPYLGYAYVDKKKDHYA